MGAWIEISTLFFSARTLSCRTPRWVRGLKSAKRFTQEDEFGSHPTMGAWIEISLKEQNNLMFKVAPHDGCVD